MASVLDLLAYLQDLQDKKIYPRSKHIATVSNFFKQHHTPKLDIYNMFWEDRGLSSDMDNETLRTYVNRLKAIHTKIDEIANSDVYDIEIPDYFEEFSDKFEDIYQILIDNLQSKSNEYLYSVRSDKMNIVGKTIYPLEKTRASRTIKYAIHPSIKEISYSIINYTDTDTSNKLKGVYKNVSPFLNTVTGVRYYESLYEFTLSIEPLNIASDEIVEMKMIDGTRYLFTGTISVDANSTTQIYSKPILVNQSTDSMVVTNSYISLYYNNNADISLNPRIESALYDYIIEYRRGTNIKRIYNQGIDYIIALIITYYDTTEYALNIVPPSDEYKYYKLSEGTKVYDCDIKIDGNDLLTDRTATFPVSSNMGLTITMNSSDSRIENLAISFIKEV